MTNFTFDYRKDNHGNMFAFLPFHLSREGFEGRAIPMTGVLDSGAAYSVFKAEVGDALGIPIERGRKVMMKGVGGDILCYAHEVLISINGQPPFKIPVFFSRQFHFHTNLIGQTGVFDLHKVTFEKTKGTATLEETH